MLGLLQGLIQHQDHAGQHGHAAQDAQQHALGHHDAQVAAQGEAHEAQSNEARDGGDGAADDAGQGLLDGHRHGFLVIRVLLALLVVAVPQEDGVVHGHGQLEHGGQGLGDVGNFTQPVVGAHVQQDHGPDGNQEHQRDQPAIQQQEHGHAGQQHCQADINRLLLLAQVFQVHHQRRHAGHKALLAADASDLLNGLHGAVLAGAAVEEHGHHSGVVGIEFAVHLFRQQLHGDAQVGQGIIPQHGGHVVDALHLFFQGGHILFRHILEDQEGEGSLVEVLQQFILADDGLHVAGQVGQHVIVDTGGRHAHYRGDHQQQRQDQDRDAVFDDRF